MQEIFYLFHYWILQYWDIGNVWCCRLIKKKPITNKLWINNQKFIPKYILYASIYIFLCAHICAFSFSLSLCMMVAGSLSSMTIARLGYALNGYSSLNCTYFWNFECFDIVYTRSHIKLYSIVLKFIILLYFMIFAKQKASYCISNQMHYIRL